MASTSSTPRRSKAPSTSRASPLEGYGDLSQTMRFIAPDDGNQDDHTVMEITLPKPLAPQ